MINTSYKILEREAALHRINSWRITGQSIVFTNGCFDLLHPGHVTYLEAARSLGDRLVLGLNDDASVRRLKGDTRPILKLEDRARILAGLAAIDLVVPFGEDTPRELILMLRPDLLVKGGDYTVDQIAGAEEVQSWGGEVKIITFVDGHSTTSLIERMKK
ncbi:MAG: D-glycero-beta-D-manno-heptose 1-phosphate adenylyltransferase [Bacteroidia bacterium]|nr:D-glycero-beta-D-manno-heptose 1-phosphate adenylyltransferase [Bacteroidia bacterium]